MLDFIRQNAAKLAEQTLVHLGLMGLSLLLALVLGLPLGIALARQPRLASLGLGLAGVLQTVPSIALLGVLIPVLGIGVLPALVALFLYALLPILRNTVVGIREVDPALTEVARGMGMTAGQVLRRVELPLAMPVIFAGVRTAAVINVGVATLAAYVAAGGLGEFIFGGIALNNVGMMLAGAIPAALLAVGVDAALAAAQRLRLRKLRVASLVLVGVLPLLSGFYFVNRAGQTRLVAAFAHEFVGRSDGYPGLRKTYGLEISTNLLDQNLLYEALRSGKVEVISGNSTDGRVRAFDLKILTDDRGVFPPYFAAPVVRRTALARFPEVGPTLELLAGRLPDSVMIDLNYRADYLHHSPERVAREFLQRVGLYQKPAPGPRPERVRIGSKIFTEQYILSEIYRQLLEGHTRLGVDTKTGLGGTQLCFDALRTGAIDFYPEYTGTGLLVILQPPQRVLDSLGSQPQAVYRYVDAEFARRYDLDWLRPLGFNDSYALLMRRQQAETLGLRTISELTGYLK